MKNVIAVLFQFFLFLLVFAAGSLLVHPFHLETALAPVDGRTRVFLWDGVLLMALAYGLVLLLAAGRRRLRSVAGGSSLALALAALAGWAMRFGFITHGW
ncbi:MAG TPA: hypothetical protein VNW54_09070 [Granulicella sp.]|jgi:hypothetical protein|nr:hypothetical protein [Granulicella sp.]